MLADSPDTSTTCESESSTYWRETRRPFCNLIFLLPLILIYEIGVRILAGDGGESIRNGADAWMRVFLVKAGIELSWLPPLLLVGTLVAWHLSTKQPWKMNWDTYGGMAAESFLYAFVLIMLGQITDYGFRQSEWKELQFESTSHYSGYLVRMITFMGAGIYEEFLFRLCSLPIVYFALRGLFVPRNWAVAGTVVTTSLVFSLAHYLGPSSDGHAMSLLTDAVVRVQSSRDLWFGFSFRLLAGMFFAALYFLRGFGIAVGAHAVYDVFVGVILIHEI